MEMCIRDRYNTFLQEGGYGTKYDLGDARMFVIEGMEKVRRVIAENRKRKLTKHKRLSNNTVIEIDNCSPLEILKLQKNLQKIARGCLLYTSQNFHSAVSPM